MEHLPPAPDPGDLPDLKPTDLTVFPAGTRMWRLYFYGGEHPSLWNLFRSFGPVKTARFDHHMAPARDQDRGIMYGAPESREAMITCVAEVFQDTRTIDANRNSPWIASLRTTEEIRLLDVTSAWTTRAGGNQAICSGDRGVAREWSRAIYARYLDIDGIAYVSSTYGPGRAAALFERAGTKLAGRPAVNRPLNDPGLRDFLRRTAHKLNYALL